MSDFVDWEKPLPFVILDDNKKLQINQDTATLLSKIYEAAVVVGISGIYRNGKSYLMNRIAKKRKGFTVGHELQTETKGIWIWCLKHPLKSNTVLVLLDSEGLDCSHEDNRTQDSQLITLAVLLSSALLYNVTEKIDANSIDKLHFMTELVKRIKLNKPDQEENANTNLVPDQGKNADTNLVPDQGKNADTNLVPDQGKNADTNLVPDQGKNADTNLVPDQGKNADTNLVPDQGKNADTNLVPDQGKNADTNLVHFSMYFPLFILVIRNFTLKMKFQGSDITSDEYFATSLAPKDDDNKSEASFNQPRRIIQNAFRNRRCFTLPIPYRGTEEEEDLDNIPDDKLAPKFINKCDELCQFIYKEAPVKKIGLGNIITVQTLVALCEGYIERMNSDHHICLVPTTAYVIEKQNEEVKKSCMKIYRDEMNKCTFPLSDKDFLDFHNLANDKALAYFRKHVYFDEEGNIFKDIKDLIPKECIEFKIRNDTLSLEKCTKILDDLYEVHLADKISTLYRSGGYQEYQRLMDKVLEEYDKQTKEEIMTLQSKEIFLSKLKNEKVGIMTADNALTQSEREKEQTKQDAESKDRKEKIAHMVKEKESSLRENLTKKYQDDFRKLQQQMEQSEGEFSEECKTMIQIRIQEKEELTRKGHTDEAKELEYQINELRKMIELHNNKIDKRRLKIVGILTSVLAWGFGIGIVLLTGGAAAIPGGVAALTGGAVAITGETAAVTGGAAALTGALSLGAVVYDKGLEKLAEGVKVVRNILKKNRETSD